METRSETGYVSGISGARMFLRQENGRDLPVDVGAFGSGFLLAGHHITAVFAAPRDTQDYRLALIHNHSTGRYRCNGQSLRLTSRWGRLFQGLVIVFGATGALAGLNALGALAAGRSNTGFQAEGFGLAAIVLLGIAYWANAQDARLQKQRMKQLLKRI